MDDDNDGKVVRIKSIKNIDSDMITPELLLEVIGEEVEENQPEKMFCILVDKDGYRYYNSKMKDEEIVTVFEAIKMFMLANKFGSIEYEE